MDLEQNETRNACAGEAQMQFNRPTVLRWHLERYEADVRWSPGCEDSSQAAEDRALLGDVTKQCSEDRDWQH
jgi:hypothetical protein